MANQFDPMKRRPPDAHKGDFGRVALIGGSRGMAGSIALSSIAALRTGSGLVTAIIPDAILETVASFHPAVMTVPVGPAGSPRFDPNAADRVAESLQKMDAVGIGPGMGTDDGSLVVLQRVLSDCPVPLVIDADAINLIARHNLLIECRRFETKPPWILTPHAGELQRLTGVPTDDRQQQIAAAEQLARQYNLIVVVKGGPTVTVTAGRRVTNDTGNPGMATAGCGDVLTGMITSLLGQGLDPTAATLTAVHHHGAAGDRAADRYGPAAMTAAEVASSIRIDHRPKSAATR